MKTKLLLMLACSSFISFGQAPISSFYSDHNIAFAVVTSSALIDQSASGANLTWDFNQLTSTGSSVYHNTTPTAAELLSYPNATSVIINTSGINSTNTISKLYSSSLANVVSITAAKSNDLELNYATDNATLGAFPMNYGFSNTDTTAGTYTYTTYSGTFTGTITTTVDAYGRLNTSGTGSLPYSGNVIRLKTVQNISLNYSFFGTVGTVTQTTYSYFDATIGVNHNQFKYSITHVKVPLLSIDQTITQMESFQAILLGTEQVEHQSNQAIIAPNPVEDILNIQTNKNQKIHSVMIFDTNGRTVLTSDYSENSLNVNQLQEGVYFAKINTDTGVITRKIMKK